MVTRHDVASPDHGGQARRAALGGVGVGHLDRRAQLLPTTPSTDHARERVPLLVAGARVRGGSVGERDTFSDLGATVADWFGLSWRGHGTSFLPTLLHA